MHVTRQQGAIIARRLDPRTRFVSYVSPRQSSQWPTRGRLRLLHSLPPRLPLRSCRRGSEGAQRAETRRNCATAWGLSAAAEGAADGAFVEALRLAALMAVARCGAII